MSDILMFLSFILFVGNFGWFTFSFSYGIIKLPKKHIDNVVYFMSLVVVLFILQMLEPVFLRKELNDEWEKKCIKAGVGGYVVEGGKKEFVFIK